MQEIARIKKEGGMQFSYIAGSEAEQYEFVRIPKTLISSDYFADLSNPSRILYGLLFDRMSASPKNRWLDSEGACICRVSGAGAYGRSSFVREESQELPSGAGKDRTD